MARTIAIHPGLLPDKALPYPYFILPDGGVDRQDFWKGDPAALIGFQDRIDVQTVNLLTERFLDAPHLALGKYPVFVTDGRMWAYKVAVDQVDIHDPDAPVGHPVGPVTRQGWAEAQPPGVHDTEAAVDDRQVGRSYWRRFVKPLDDGTWATVTVSTRTVRPEQDRHERDGDDAGHAEGSLRLEMRTTHVLCTDPADPESTATYTDSVSEDIGPAEASVPWEPVADFQHERIVWTGVADQEQPCRVEVVDRRDQGEVLVTCLTHGSLTATRTDLLSKARRDFLCDLGNEYRFLVRDDYSDRPRLLDLTGLGVAVRGMVEQAHYAGELVDLTVRLWLDDDTLLPLTVRRVPDGEPAARTDADRAMIYPVYEVVDPSSGTVYLRMTVPLDGDA